MSRVATVEGDDRFRLFLALEPPAHVVRELVVWGKRHLGCPCARPESARADSGRAKSWGRPPSSFHVTLAFLGNQPREALEPIRGILREEAAVSASFLLEPVRYQETRTVGMLVLADPSGEATRLAERLHGRLEEAGVYRREARPWLPHITVLRFRRRPKLSPPLPEIERFAPSGAAALLSRLHPSGARYEVLESCSLGNGDPGG